MIDHPYQSILDLEVKVLLHLLLPIRYQEQ